MSTDSKDFEFVSLGSAQEMVSRRLEKRIKEKTRARKAIITLIALITIIPMIFYIWNSLSSMVVNIHISGLQRENTFILVVSANHGYIRPLKTCGYWKGIYASSIPYNQFSGWTQAQTEENGKADANHQLWAPGNQIGIIILKGGIYEIYFTRPTFNQQLSFTLFGGEFDIDLKKCISRNLSLEQMDKLKTQGFAEIN
ncbi:unnamed protein product [Tuwongella immobilis]|uniref:Uncharacterized protein n=1 Tax=Tuwongella immobilis TaxID=692036 RepID=A0A6C2YRL2_9BACT|nr:unnamed protein product [Tuwongella immobilis]VTS04618.1 unnamed protein product [Tuwongella immobilis]